MEDTKLNATSTVHSILDDIEAQQRELLEQCLGLGSRLGAVLREPWVEMPSTPSGPIITSAKISPLAARLQDLRRLARETNDVVTHFRNNLEV